MALNGTISKNAALQVRVNSNDLHELETISAAFRAPESAAFGLYGQAVLMRRLAGPPGAHRSRDNSPPKI